MLTYSLSLLIDTFDENVGGSSVSRYIMKDEDDDYKNLDKDGVLQRNKGGQSPSISININPPYASPPPLPPPSLPDLKTQKKTQAQIPLYPIVRYVPGTRRIVRAYLNHPAIAISRQATGWTIRQTQLQVQGMMASTGGEEDGGVVPGTMDP
ncbi:MAG: hypothetical protein Q9168_004666, partial [Polycauliona sp. 1 TL-2023]